MDTLFYIFEKCTQVLILIFVLALFTSKRCFYGYNDKTQVQ